MNRAIRFAPLDCPCLPNAPLPPSPTRLAPRAMPSALSPAAWTALWRPPWCTRCWAIACTASLWTTACCGSRWGQWGAGDIVRVYWLPDPSLSHLYICQQSWLPSAPPMCSSALLGCTCDRVCDHSQEAERVMETFNSHLHLPVTCIDHSKVITGGGRKKGGGTRRAHTVICLSPTGR